MILGDKVISRRKRRKKQIRIIVTVIVLLFLSILFLNNKSNITKIERVFKTIGITTVDVFNYPIEIVEKKLIESRKEKNLEKAIIELEEKVKEYQKIEKEYNELKYQMMELETSLDLKLLPNRKSIAARVVNRSVGAWYNELTINKGEKDGLIIGSPVVTTTGLVGNVTKLTDYYATVKLITSKTIENISVKIGQDQDSKYGIMKSYKDGLFSIEVLEVKELIEVGSLVTTTGLTSNYPAGIIIGIVEKVELDNFGLSQVVKVKSSINFNKISYVEVILGDL